MTRALVWLLAALGLALPAVAQERPGEEALFGADVEVADAGVSAAVIPTGNTRDDSVLSSGPAQSRFDTDESRADPVKVGGTLYLRGTAAFNDRSALEDTAFSAPGLLDVYLDARPNERVRGMALGRLRYDPTVGAAGATPAIPGIPTAATSNPSVALDQLWLRFDALQTLFFTVGRQKVKWGAARLWNPTDFLNATRRDILNPFDLRLGINAVKVHLPVESLGWNFYGFGLLDNNGPANLLGRLGGAARAEFVVKQTEFSLSGVWGSERRPRYAVDISSALGPVDVYAEAAFRSGKDFTVWKVDGAFDQTLPIQSLFREETPAGIQVQAAGGVSLMFNYTDKDLMVVGAEYFYNPVGYSSPLYYPWLLYQGAYTPFYLGQHYVGVFASAPGLPGYNWISLTLTNLVNVSDPSGVVRLDAFFRVLTFLQVETWASVNYGLRGGEFRFALDLPPLPLGDGSFSPETHLPAPTTSVGLGLRVSI